MTTLTTKIREVIGKGTNSSGRGQSWMYIDEGTFDKDGRNTLKENNDCVDRLLKAFPDNIQFEYESGMELNVFFIYDNKNNYLGSCKINKWNEERGCYITVNYTYTSKLDIIESLEKYFIK